MSSFRTILYVANCLKNDGIFLLPQSQTSPKALSNKRLTDACFDCSILGSLIHATEFHPLWKVDYFVLPNRVSDTG